MLSAVNSVHYTVLLSTSKIFSVYAMSMYASLDRFNLTMVLLTVHNVTYTIASHYNYSIIVFNTSIVIQLETCPCGCIVHVIETNINKNHQH